MEITQYQKPEPPETEESEDEIRLRRQKAEIERKEAYLQFYNGLAEGDRATYDYIFGGK